ncbi:MAG: hypothetical protein LUG83_02400 [Lachnospiraceae bacterium]|nr:hypothetical protein [Lachnospiraceae bacterium]
MFEDMEYKIAGRTKSILIVAFLALIIWQYTDGHPFVETAGTAPEGAVLFSAYVKWCFERLLRVF